MKKLFILLFTFLVFEVSAQLPNGGMHFDGNDRITISSNPYVPGTGAITIEAWVKLDTLMLAGLPIISNRGFTGTLGFAIYATPSGTVTAIFAHQQAITSGLTTCFVHVAVVRENYDTRIFIDGVLHQTSTDTLIEDINSTSTLYIGYDALGSEFFRGILKEVRIWRIARTAAEIQSTMNNALIGSNYPDLEAYWRCDDTSQVILDYSVSGINGLRGSTAFNETTDPAFTTTDTICGLPTTIYQIEKSYSLTSVSSNNGWTFHPSGNFISGSIELFNSQGKILFSKNVIGETIFFGENFPSGIYFMKVNSTAGTGVEKLIKEK
jgi:hypothetical protein